MKTIISLMIVSCALISGHAVWAQSLHVPRLDPAYQSKMLQHLQNMTPEQMANMQGALMDGHRCMAQIDEETRNRLQQRGYDVGERLKALCREGARDDAHYYARSQSEAFVRDPAMQKLRQCSEQAASAFAEFMQSVTASEGNQHVCDGL